MSTFEIKGKTSRNQTVNFLGKVFDGVSDSYTDAVKSLTCELEIIKSPSPCVFVLRPKIKTSTFFVSYIFRASIYLIRQLRKYKDNGGDSKKLVTLGMEYFFSKLSIKCFPSVIGKQK